MDWAIVAAIVVLFLGAIIFVASVFIGKVASNAKRMSNLPAYSKTVRKAVIASGIYTEHGMVDSRSGKGVRAQMKKSGSYYESLI